MCPASDTASKWCHHHSMFITHWNTETTSHKSLDTLPLGKAIRLNGQCLHPCWPTRNMSIVSATECNRRADSGNATRWTNSQYCKKLHARMSKYMTEGAFSVTRPTLSVMSPTKRESSLQCIKTRKTSFKNVVRTSKTYVSPCRTCRKKEEALLSWHCSHWHAHKCIQKEWCSLSQTLTAETFCSIKRFVSKTANLHDKKPANAF